MKTITVNEALALAPSLKHDMSDHEVDSSSMIELRTCPSFSNAGQDLFAFSYFYVSSVGDSYSSPIASVNLAKAHEDKTYPGVNMDSTTVLYKRIDPSAPGYVMTRGRNLEETSYTLHRC